MRCLCQPGSDFVVHPPPYLAGASGVGLEERLALRQAIRLLRLRPEPSPLLDQPPRLQHKDGKHVPTGTDHDILPPPAILNFGRKPCHSGIRAGITSHLAPTWLKMRIALLPPYFVPLPRTLSYNYGEPQKTGYARAPFDTSGQACRSAIFCEVPYGKAAQILP